MLPLGRPESFAAGTALVYSAAGQALVYPAAGQLFLISIGHWAIFLPLGSLSLSAAGQFLYAAGHIFDAAGQSLLCMIWVGLVFGPVLPYICRRADGISWLEYFQKL